MTLLTRCVPRRVSASPRRSLASRCRPAWSRLRAILHELVNPHIVRSSGDDNDLEGCLSIPGYVAYVTRREQVWVVAQNRKGRRIKVSGQGLLSRAMQHELDHLQGKLYIDYLDSMDELIPVAQLHEETDAEEEELAPLA